MALTFDYKVRDRTGNLVQGQLEGDSLALVVGKLREMGYMPVAVTPKSRCQRAQGDHHPRSLQPGQAGRDGRGHPAAGHHGRLGSVGGAGPRAPRRPDAEQGTGPGPG